MGARPAPPQQPCRHCPDQPAYAIWRLPWGEPIHLCRQHFEAATDRPGRNVSLIPAGASAPRRVDDVTDSGDSGDAADFNERRDHPDAYPRPATQRCA